jgi:hypothetical protein
MFLARSLSSVVTFCSGRPLFKMAAVTKNRNFFNCPLLLDLNVIFYQNMPNLHNRYISAERKFPRKTWNKG